MLVHYQQPLPQASAPSSLPCRNIMMQDGSNFEFTGPLGWRWRSAGARSVMLPVSICPGRTYIAPSAGGPSARRPLLKRLAALPAPTGRSSWRCLRLDPAPSAERCSTTIVLAAVRGVELFPCNVRRHENAPAPAPLLPELLGQRPALGATGARRGAHLVRAPRWGGQAVARRPAFEGV